MVSTRSVKYKFSENEKVLCYEPDPTKAKVLYDSKVLQVVETKDKRGRKVIEYLIHFQGWNPSWDRRVKEDFVLKDTEENRQLQRDLAEKSQLQLGAYLYRKERKKRKRNMSSTNSENKTRMTRYMSDDGSSCSRDDNDFTNDDAESESYSSSVESTNEDDRLVLRLGTKLKKILEYDYKMIHENNKILNLPAKIPVIKILNDFVKQFAIRIICYPKEEPSFNNISKRRRRSSHFLNNKHNTQTKIEDALVNIDLCKEVVDGIRIYFDFTLKDYLLYNNEKEQCENLLSEENLKNFKYTPSDEIFSSINIKTDCLPSHHPFVNETSEQSTHADSSETERCKRRLRSYTKFDETESSDVNSVKQENCVSSVASTSSESSAQFTGTSSDLNFLKSALPINIGIPVEGKKELEKILHWELLPTDTPNEASMIYGPIHLARLIIKLPDFLNVSTISDEKLKVLIKHLDAFVEFLEEHSEWFGEQNYCDKILE